MMGFFLHFLLIFTVNAASFKSSLKTKTLFLSIMRKKKKKEMPNCATFVTLKGNDVSSFNTYVFLQE